MKAIPGGKIEFKKATCKFEGAGIDPMVKEVTALVLGKARLIVHDTKDAGLMPILFFGDIASGAVGMVPGEDFSSNDGKEGFSQMAKAICAKAKANFTIFLSESYAVSAIGEEAQEAYNAWRKANPDASLGDYSGSADVLMVTVETLHGIWMTKIEIKKSTDGRSIDIDSIEFSKYSGMEGRMVNFLPIKAVNN